MVFVSVWLLFVGVRKYSMWMCAWLAGNDSGAMHDISELLGSLARRAAEEHPFMPKLNLRSRSREPRSLSDLSLGDADRIAQVQHRRSRELASCLID